MKRMILFTAAALLLGSLATAQDGTMMKSDNSSGDGSMMKGDSMMKADPNGGSMMKKDDSVYDVSMLGKQVVPFTSEMAAQALAKKGTVVYFFAATWCPDCQATYKDLKANYAKLPMNLTLVFVNYDKSADLKKKYGITVQHTFVVVGPMGEKKKVWSGASTVAEIVKNATSM